MKVGLNISRPSVHFRKSLIDSRTFKFQSSSVCASSASASCSDVLVMRPWRASPSRPTGPSLPASLSSLSPARARARTHASPPPVAARPSVSHLLTFLRSFALYLLLPPSLPLPDISVQLTTPNRSGIGNHTGAGVDGGGVIGNGAPAAMDIGRRLDQGCQILHFWRMHFFHKLQPELQWTRRSGFGGNCCSAAEGEEDYLRTS